MGLKYFANELIIIAESRDDLNQLHAKISTRRTNHTNNINKTY